MKKCFKDYTVIYSQPSIEALENLIKDFTGTFGLVEEIDDMFTYGVFCKPENYANFDYDTTFSNKLEVPDILANTTASVKEKIDYVKGVINQILRKEIQKPEWMKEVELSACNDEFNQPPSTFLYIYPKSSEYEALAQRLTEFLYSPNKLTTMIYAQQLVTIYNLNLIKLIADITTGRYPELSKKINNMTTEEFIDFVGYHEEQNLWSNSK